MQVVSSMKTIAPAPRAEPALCTASISRGRSRCSGRRTCIEPPPGWKALSERPFQIPRHSSSSSSRIGVPSSIS